MLEELEWLTRGTTEATTKNLIPSPTKHLKFPLDNYTQKTVA